MNRNKDQKPFMALMAVLQTVFDRDAIGKDKLGIYFEYLMDLSLSELKRAVDEIVRTRKYTTMPTIAEIREAALGLKDEDVTADALTAWREAELALISGHPVSPRTHEAIRLAFGGMSGFGQAEPGNEFVKKRFLDCYKDAVKRERLRPAELALPERKPVAALDITKES